MVLHRPIETTALIRHMARRLAEQGGPVDNHGQLSHKECLGLYLTISVKWRRLLAYRQWQNRNLS
jgi:hypothetical protein